MYIEKSFEGNTIKGKVKTVIVTTKGRVVPLDLTIGVSVSVILLVVIIFVTLFILWKRKYPAYTQIERREDGRGMIFCL